MNLFLVTSTSFTDLLLTIGYVILGLLGLMLMIVIHEFGHYISGKLLGFKILEFGIGFGPPIIKRTNKKNGELFTIRPIPLGGFCRFEDEEEDSSSPTAFNNQPPWKRIIVLFSGALFNFISGLLILALIFTLHGQATLKISNLYPDSINTNTTLQEGDIVLKVDDKILNILEMDDALRPFRSDNEEVKLEVLRNGEKVSVLIKKSVYTLGTFNEEGVFEEDPTGETYLGYGFQGTVIVQKFNFFTAFSRAFSYMFFLVIKILSIFGKLFTGKTALSSLGGPITTIQVMTEASKAGLTSLIYIISIVSANLAVMNLLPLPALDGSKIVFCILEMIRKKPLNRKVENIIHLIGFFSLILFAVFLDVYKLF